MPRYVVSNRTNNAPTATLPGSSLYAIASVDVKVREIGIFNSSSTACVISVNRLNSAGTPGTGLTESKVGNPAGTRAADATAFAAHTSTPPTLGDEIRRADLGGAQGAGAIWTWDDEPLVVPAGTANGIGFICPTGTGQVIDFYIEWEE